MGKADTDNTPLSESINEVPADSSPASSTFLNVGETVLLDSQATGPWMIVSETGK